MPNAGWFKAPTGQPVYMDEQGLVHLQNVSGQVDAVPLAQAHEALAHPERSGYSPASQDAVNAAQHEAAVKAAWDNASIGKKTEFYAREGVKGAVDAVTALPRAAFGAGMNIAKAVTGSDAQVANPLEAASGEQVVQKIDQVLGNSAQGVAANAAEQRTFGEANPGGKLAANLAGNVAGLVATAGLGAAGKLLTGGGLFGGASLAARTGGTALEGAAQSYAAGAENAWAKDQAYSTEAQWAHMGLGAVLGGAGSLAIEGAGAAARTARNVFGAPRAAAEAGEKAATGIGRSGDSAADALETIVDMPPAPGAAGKLRSYLNSAQEFLESRAANKIGMSKEAVAEAAEYGPGTAELRRLTTGHEGAIKTGTEDLSGALKDLHENAEPIFKEDVSLDLKRENIKHLMTGDESTMRAVGEAKAQEFEETLERVKAASKAGEDARSLFGDSAASKDLRFAYKDAIDGLRNADHPADIVIALDTFKREMGAVQKRAVNVSRSAASGEAQKQALARSDLATSVYADTKALLEDASTWGKFGDAQRIKNARWTRVLSTDDFVHPQLNRQIGEMQTATEFTRPRYAVDPAKVESYLQGLGTNKSKLLDDALRDNIVAKKDLATSLVDLYGLGQHTESVQKVIAASDKALATLHGIDRSVASTNQVLTAVKAMQDLQGGAQDFSTMGAIAGSILGPAGSVAGSKIGKLANLASPVGMLRQFVGFRHAATKVSDAVNSAIDSTLFKATAAAASQAAKGASRVASRAAYSNAEYDHAANAITKIQADPQHAVNTLADHTQHIEHPSTRDAMVDVGARMTGFLATKMPVSLYQDPAVASKPWENVSTTERDKFMRYVRAAQDPMAIFKDIKSGTATEEQAETLRICFPSIYAKAQMQVVQAFTSGKVKASFQERLRMQQLFQLDIEPAAKPGLQEFLKQAGAAANQQQAAKSAGSAGAPSVAKNISSNLNNLKV